MHRGWLTIVCAATGPSFSEDQAQIITAARRDNFCRIIAINDNWRRLPCANILFAPDRSWWRIHVGAIRASGFAGELWTVQEKAAQMYGLHHVKHKHGEGLHPQPDTINCGGNSGFMAINLAYLFGAQRIVLVGYDMKKSPTGQTHWFGNHPAPLSNASPYSTFIKRFAPLAADLERVGVIVINATADSALPYFPRHDLADALIALEAVE
jgi:hypothetical protein